MFSIAALTPVLLLPSFTKISSLAFVGCLSTVLVVLVAIGTVADDPVRHHMPLQASLEPLSHRTAEIWTAKNSELTSMGLQPPPGHDLASWSLFKGIGIFAVSVSGGSPAPAKHRRPVQPQ